jgi:hypothetical protein
MVNGEIELGLSLRLEGIDDILRENDSLRIQSGDMSYHSLVHYDQPWLIVSALNS